MLQILNFRMLRAFRENFGENFRRERPKIVHSRSRKTRMKPSKTGKPLPKSQLDFESFSLRPLRYISKYIFMANLRFVYRKSALKLGTVAVRILLENASFRQVLKPVRTSKLTFPRVIWRHPAKHPLGFRVVLVTTTSIHLHIQIMLWSAVQTFTLIILQLCHYTKNPAFRQLVFIAEEGAHAAPTRPHYRNWSTGCGRSPTQISAGR